MSKALRQKLAAFAAAIFFVGGILNTYPVFAYPMPVVAAAEYSGIIEAFNDHDGRIMSVSHRGDWRNHPENSLSAIQSCIDMGVDIVELDVRKSLDGELFLMHDSSVAKTTNGSGMIEGSTAEYIKSLRLKSGQGGSGAKLTDEKVPTLAEALDVAKGKIMINLDKCNTDELRELCYNVIKEKGCVESVIFKDKISVDKLSQWNSSLETSGDVRPKFSIMINGESNLDNALNYVRNHASANSPDMIELIFKDETVPAANSELIKYGSVRLSIVQQRFCAVSWTLALQDSADWDIPCLRCSSEQ